MAGQAADASGMTDPPWVEQAQVRIAAVNTATDAGRPEVADLADAAPDPARVVPHPIPPEDRPAS
jgi:hypothetical protein